jgi:hypothetical protein
MRVTRAFNEFGPTFVVNRRRGRGHGSSREQRS